MQMTFVWRWALTSWRSPILLATGLMAGAVLAGPVRAEMTYSPTLPQFGGGNGQAFELLKFEKQGADAEKAKAAALLAAVERAANQTATTNADRLVAAITNYLNVEIARRFSIEILDGDAPTGNFTVGDVTIGYTRSDGFLSLVISDRNGSTTIELPVVE
jgi:hypothetical protein